MNRLYEAYNDLESDFIRLFHGNNYNVTEINPARMYGFGNNQEGVGIYFGSEKKIAEHYGSTVISIFVNKKHIKNSDDLLVDVGLDPFNIFKDAQVQDEEAFFYYASDRVIVTEPDEIDDNVLRDLVVEVAEEKLQFFQADMAEIMGSESFVASWNKHCDIRALRGSTDKTFYAVTC